MIRAFWLGVQFIRNAQRTQHEKAEIPVRAFALNDYSEEEPTKFEYEYIQDGVKYIYGFSATRKEIKTEYLFAAPKRKKSEIFTRKGKNFLSQLMEKRKRKK